MRKLAIVGRGKNPRLALKTDREIWAVSTAYDKIGKADKVFNLHLRSELLEPWLFCGDFEAITVFEHVNGSIFPVQEIIDTFGSFQASSVSWIIGYAIIQGYTDIAFYGIDMAHPSEYGIQRDSFFYMVGQAVARGVKITTQPDSGIYMEPVQYG